MVESRTNSYSISLLNAHIVWTTQYRFHILRGDVQNRCRDLLIQICNSERVRILKGVVGRDYVYLQIEYPPTQSISSLLRKLKVRTSHSLQQEFPELHHRFWGQHFWDVGYGAWSAGDATDEIVQEFLARPKEKPNTQLGNWTLEK